jgi:hypothetical protein
MKSLRTTLILVGLMSLIVVAWGSDVGTLVTFSPSTVISSSAVNQNFTDIKTAVNSKNDKLLSGCAGGQVVNGFSGGVPICTPATAVTGVGDVTGLLQGTGTLITNAGGPTPLVAVDTSVIQNRVTGTCLVGSAVQSVAQTGSVSCQSVANRVTRVLYSNIPFINNPPTTFVFVGSVGIPFAKLSSSSTLILHWSSTGYGTGGISGPDQCFVQIRLTDTGTSTTYADGGTGVRFTADGAFHPVGYTGAFIGLPAASYSIDIFMQKSGLVGQCNDNPGGWTSSVIVEESPS